eukprot:PhM_4_TR10389/c1_g1_i3/m.31034
MKTLGLTVHSCRRGAMGFLAELGYAMREIRLMSAHTLTEDPELAVRRYINATANQTEGLKQREMSLKTWRSGGPVIASYVGSLKAREFSCNALDDTTWRPFKLRERPDDIPKWENVADEGDAVDIDVTFFSSNVMQKLAVINATGRFVRFSPRSLCRLPLAWITVNRLRLDALCRLGPQDEQLQDALSWIVTASLVISGAYRVSHA